MGEIIDSLNRVGYNNELMEDLSRLGYEPMMTDLWNRLLSFHLVKTALRLHQKADLFEFFRNKNDGKGSCSV